MKNDRPISDPDMQKALDHIMSIIQYYDLSGGVYLVNKDEMGFAYQMPATWNAFVEDNTLPLGFRIRAISGDIGKERAKEFIEGAVWVMGAMIDFGIQSRMWGQDLINLMKQLGITIDRTPRNIPHLGGFDARKK